MTNQPDRRSFDINASGEAQSQFNAVASQLEGLIAGRDADVARAMAQYQAEGVSEEYAAKERRWHAVADQVKGIITTLRSSLASNDDTAQTALQRAGAAVAGIG